MLISFSVDAMRPMLAAGFRQYCGEDVGDQRVKRQTIRQLGPRIRRLLTVDNPAREMDLHLWWKSRTPARAFIGQVERWTVRSVTIERMRDGISIRTDAVKSPADFDALAHADGFDSFDDFAKYFVPNPGDMFQGGLYKW